MICPLRQANCTADCAWRDGEQCAVMSIADAANSVTLDYRTHLVDGIFSDFIDRLKKSGVIA